MGCSPSGCSVYGILQVSILEWVAMPFFKGSSLPRDWTGSPALQADLSPSEPLGKPLCKYILYIHIFEIPQYLSLRSPFLQSIILWCRNKTPPPQKKKLSLKILCRLIIICMLRIPRWQAKFWGCAVLNRFSGVQLCVTLWIVAHQAPLSMGLSRQEYWSGLPCPPSSRGFSQLRDRTHISSSLLLWQVVSLPLVPPGKSPNLGDSVIYLDSQFLFWFIGHPLWVVANINLAAFYILPLPFLHSSVHHTEEYGS